MAPVLWWSWLDLRRRWRSLVVLGMLVALAAGTVVAAVAGARRGATALDRLLAVTLPATVVVLPNEPGFDWDAVRAIPGVEGLSTFVVGGPKSVDGVPGEEVFRLPPADGEAMRTVERPVVLEGRLPDPARADEVVVSPRFESSYGKGVGDTVAVLLESPEQVDAFILGQPSEADGAAGPTVEATIVGVIRSGWYSEEATEDRGFVVPSPGLFGAYPENFLGAQDSGYVNALVRLEGGEAGIPAFRERLATVSGRPDIDVWVWAEGAERVRKVTRFEANSLVIFAGAAAVASVFLIGQAVARYASAATSDLALLGAFGLTPSQQRVGALAGPALAAVGGSVLGTAAAVVASRWFPIGTASLYEPSPGLGVDWVVSGPALVIVPLIVAAGSAFAATRAISAPRRAQPARSSGLATVAARAGVPVPAVVGTRFALEPGRGRQAVPVRPALLGAVVGVMGVLAALTFSHGVGDAADNPARFGVVHDLEAFLGFNGDDLGDSGAALGAVAADPDVLTVNDTRSNVAKVEGHAVDVFTLDPLGPPLGVVVTEGRLPASPGELALAPRSAKAIGLGPGDTVEIVGTRGSQRAMVSGLAFVPAAPHNDYATGAWATRQGYDELFDGFRFHLGLVALRPGADPAVVAERVGSVVGEGWFGLQPPAPPVEISELRQVRALPLFLAGFLALLGLGAVGHALATAVRRRRHDVAVLRALGMTRGGSRAVVVTQAMVLALLGVIAGVPLGVALGRIVWRAVAESTPLLYVAPVAGLALLLVVPAALASANALAAWPSHRAARLRPGEVLRAE